MSAQYVVLRHRHTSATGRLAARQSAQHMNKNARIQNAVRSQQTQSSFSILVIKQKRQNPKCGAQPCLRPLGCRCHVWSSTGRAQDLAPCLSAPAPCLSAPESSLVFCSPVAAGVWFDQMNLAFDMWWYRV